MFIPQSKANNHITHVVRKYSSADYKVFYLVYSLHILPLRPSLLVYSPFNLYYEHCVSKYMLVFSMNLIVRVNIDKTYGLI